MTDVTGETVVVTGGGRENGQDPGIVRVGVVFLALCQVVAGAGCEACALALDSNPPERQAREAWEMYNSPEWLAGIAIQERAYQEAADRYRDQIVPGVGCDVCPKQCNLVDLRPIEWSEYVRQFRQVFFDMYSSDMMVYEASLIEHDRLVCIVQAHRESMGRALDPLLDATEHPALRLRVAIITLVSGLTDGDPVDVMYELAERSDLYGAQARGLIDTWDREGWPHIVREEAIRSDAGVP